MAVQSSVSTMILFFAKKLRPKMMSVWRVGHIMAFTMHDFYVESCNCSRNLQYSFNTVKLSKSFSLSMKAPETENVLKSLRQDRHMRSTKSEEISTGVEPWSISAPIGVGTQVAGALMQQGHHRCSGSEILGCMYSLVSSLPRTTSLSSLSSLAVIIVAPVPCLFLNAALALRAFVSVTFLQASGDGHSLGPSRQSGVTCSV